MQLTGFKDKETKEVRELPRIKFPTNGNKLGLDSFEWSVGFLYHLIKILVDLVEKCRFIILRNQSSESGDRAQEPSF